MSKLWKPNPFKFLEPTNLQFIQQQEKKLDADHNWQPHFSGNAAILEEAIPLEEYITN